MTEQKNDRRGELLGGVFVGEDGKSLVYSLPSPNPLAFITVPGLTLDTGRGPITAYVTEYGCGDKDVHWKIDPFIEEEVQVVQPSPFALRIYRREDEQRGLE